MNKDILQTELNILKGITGEATEFNGMLFLSSHSRKPDFDKWDKLSEKEQLFKLANKKVLCFGFGFLTSMEQIEQVRADAVSHKDFEEPFKLSWLKK